MKSFENTKQDNDHLDISRPTATHKRILRQLVDSVGFVNKSKLKVERSVRVHRTDMPKSDSEAHNSTERLNDKFLSNSEVCIDQTSILPSQDEDCVVLPSRDHCESTRNAFSLDSDHEVPSPVSCINMSAASSTPIIHVSVPNSVGFSSCDRNVLLNHHSSSGTQSFPASHERNTAGRPISSDGVFYISSVLNPVPGGCVQQKIADSHKHHFHERNAVPDKASLHNGSPSVVGSPVYTCRPTAQLLSHIPLHILRNSQMHSRSMQFPRNVNPSPTNHPQPHSIRPEYKIYRIADKASHINSSGSRIHHLNIQKAPVLVPISEGNSMVNIGHHGPPTMINKPVNKDCGIYLKRSVPVTSSHRSSAIYINQRISSEQPSSSSSSTMKSYDSRILEPRGRLSPTSSCSNSASCIAAENSQNSNNRLFGGTSASSDSFEHSTSSKRKRGRPPKIHVMMQDQNLGFPSRVSNSNYIERNKNLNNTAPHSDYALKNSSSTPSYLGETNLTKSFVSHCKESPTDHLAKKLIQQKQMPISSNQISVSSSVRVVLNCPYNSTESNGSGPRTPTVTTLSMTGVIFKDHIEHGSNSIEPLSQISIFHDHQPGICANMLSKPESHISDIGPSSDDTSGVGKRGSHESNKDNSNAAAACTGKQKYCSDNSETPRTASLPTDMNKAGNSVRFSSHRTEISNESSSSSRVIFDTSNDNSSEESSSGSERNWRSFRKNQQNNDTKRSLSTSVSNSIDSKNSPKRRRLRVSSSNSNFTYATTTTEGGQRLKRQHLQRCNGIDYDEIENIGCDELVLTNGQDLSNSAYPANSQKSNLSFRKEILPGGGGGAIRSIKKSLPKIAINSEHYTPQCQSVPSRSRWVTVGSPIKRTLNINGRVIDRTFFPSIRLDGLTLNVGNSVLLKSNGKCNSQPYVGLLGAFWNDCPTIRPSMKNGVKSASSTRSTAMTTILWYYRPHQTDLSNNVSAHGKDELFASKHMDDNSASCIIEKCLVLSYPKYCRYRAMKAMRKIMPNCMNDPRPLSRLNSTEALNKLLKSDLQVFFSSRLCDAKTRRVLKRIPPIFVSSSEQCSPSPLLHDKQPQL